MVQCGRLADRPSAFQQHAKSISFRTLSHTSLITADDSWAETRRRDITSVEIYRRIFSPLKTRLVLADPR